MDMVLTYRANTAFFRASSAPALGSGGASPATGDGLFGVALLMDSSSIDTRLEHHPYGQFPSACKPSYPALSAPSSFGDYAVSQRQQIEFPARFLGVSHCGQGPHCEQHPRFAFPLTIIGHLSSSAHIRRTNNMIAPLSMVSSHVLPLYTSGQPGRSPTHTGGWHESREENM